MLRRVVGVLGRFAVVNVLGRAVGLLRWAIAVGGLLVRALKVGPAFGLFVVAVAVAVIGPSAVGPALLAAVAAEEETVFGAGCLALSWKRWHRNVITRLSCFQIMITFSR